MDNNDTESQDGPLIFISYLDEGWCISAPGEPSEEDGCVVCPPAPSFAEALESAIDLSEMFSSTTVILSRAAAKIAARELRRQERTQP